MTYRDVLKYLGSGARAHLLFETFGMALLKEYLRHQQRELLTDRGEIKAGYTGINPDAVAPDGVDDLPGPTLVEFKYRAGPKDPPGSGFFTRTLASLAASAQAGRFRSVLLVYGEQLPQEVREQFEARAADWGDEIRLGLWDGYRLDRIAAQHEQFVAELLPRLARSQLEQAITVAEEEWRSPARRDELLRQLQRAYADGDVALLLGAGVSMDAGLPSWNALVETLLIRVVDRSLRPSVAATDDEIEELAARLRLVDGASPLLAARYVRRGIEQMPDGQSGSFVDEVTRAIYRKLVKGGHSARLLEAIADIARPQRSGPKIRSVVTYNFDDLLEEALGRAGVRHQSIFGEGRVAGRDELPVHHVHGFLPRDRAKYTGLDESTWAFSEEGYHALIADPYHWSNLVQLNTLREHTCVLVGLSLSDPNLRRLLEIASKRNGPSRHVAILRRTARADWKRATCGTCGAGLPESSARPEVLDALLVRHEALHEALSKELGLRVLWVDEYSEIPDVLRALQRAV